MGGQPVGSRIIEYMKSGPNTPVTKEQIAADVEGLEAKQIRTAMRRLADQGMIEIITPGSVWKLTREAWYALQSESIKQTKVDHDSPARRAREEGAAARQALRERTFEHVDTFDDGRLLVRSEAGKFFRAELTPLD